MGISDGAPLAPFTALLVLFLPAAAATLAAAQLTPICPLMEARVIPDVIDAFLPSVEVGVRYGRKWVVDGLMIPPRAAAGRPHVRIHGPRRSPHLYTLMMSDPDAPSPRDPEEREWLHWIVVDIPGRCNATKGKELMPYAGPSPPVGIHRYVFVFFQQNGTLGAIKPPASRGKFKTRAFAAEYGLGPPVAALYFNSTKKTASINN